MIVPIVVDVDKQMWLCSSKQAACSLDYRGMQPDKDTEPSLSADLTKIVRVGIHNTAGASHDRHDEDVERQILHRPADLQDSCCGQLQ